MENQIKSWENLPDQLLPEESCWGNINHNVCSASKSYSIIQILWSYNWQLFKFEVACEKYRKGMPCNIAMTEYIARLDSTNATLLIRLYETAVRSYMVCACTALTALNKSQRHRLEIIQNRCLHYARIERLIVSVFLTMNFVFVVIS